MCARALHCWFSRSCEQTQYFNAVFVPYHKDRSGCILDTVWCVSSAEVLELNTIPPVIAFYWQSSALTRVKEGYRERESLAIMSLWIYVDSVGNHHGVINQDTSLLLLCHPWTPHHCWSHHNPAHTTQHPHSSWVQKWPTAIQLPPITVDYLRRKILLLGRPRIEMCPVKMSHQRLGAQRPRRQDK